MLSELANNNGQEGTLAGAEDYFLRRTQDVLEKKWVVCILLTRLPWSHDTQEIVNQRAPHGPSATVFAP